MNEQQFASYFDHTKLGPLVNSADIKQLCTEAIKYGFASVCIPEKFVKECAQLLKDSSVKTCTVVGFPHGADSLETKVCATKNAILNGAEEIDMVISIADALAHNFDDITKEIKALKDACGKNALLKVIIEACYLQKEEKEALCQCVLEGGAEFIKTSTGFGTSGADKNDIELFSAALKGTKVLIKAAGGIRDLATTNAMINAGASRIGCSGSVTILNEFLGHENNSDTKSNY